jgi:hypothetical protein
VNTHPEQTDLAAANKVIHTLRHQLREVTIDRDALRAQATGSHGYRTTTHGALFLEPAAIADAHWEEDDA